MNLPPTWVIGLALGGGIAALAYLARALSRSGAIAAAVVGSIAMAAGWSWGIVLVTYFASSSLLSRFRAVEKEGRTEGRVEKHGARDATQVLANGGVFAAAALGYDMNPGPIWQAVAASALAASAADTWATEIGVLARAVPRSILTGKPVGIGTSGGVTVQGFLAGAAGAALVASVAWLVRWPTEASVAAMLGGVFGCALDSVVGAAFQSKRWCASCDIATEQRMHRCGAATTHTGGVLWLDNDGVNAVATLGGALLGAAAASYL